MCATAGYSVPLSLLAGVLVAGLLGFIVGFASVRLRDDFLAVTTIGVSFLFVGFVRKQQWLGAEMGISKIPASGLGPDGNAILILCFAAATIAFSLYLNRSWMGFAFRAVADDEQAARTIAIPASTYKLVAFAIGTAIAGLAGGLYAYFTQFIVPDSFGFILSVTLMAMVVIGGTGSTWGVVVATIILTLLPEVFRFINDYRLLIFGALLILVMRFAPGGLAGIVTSFSRRLAKSMTATLEVERCLDPVRRRAGAHRRLVHREQGRVRRPDRSEWRRQDHAAQDHCRRADAGHRAASCSAAPMSPGLRPSQRVRKGLAVTHQIVRPFRSMSVLDNAALAAGHRFTVNPLRCPAALAPRARKRPAPPPSSRASASPALERQAGERACRSAISSGSRSPARSPSSPR